MTRKKPDVRYIGSTMFGDVIWFFSNELCVLSLSLFERIESNNELDKIHITSPNYYPTSVQWWISSYPFFFAQNLISNVSLTWRFETQNTPPFFSISGAPPFQLRTPFQNFWIRHSCFSLLYLRTAWHNPLCGNKNLSHFFLLMSREICNQMIHFYKWQWKVNCDSEIF
jgi:hypothetical protein